MLLRHTGTQVLRPACGVALGCLHDGCTPERHTVPLRHTGTQVLCPACGVALGCLWEPIALLLDCTALRPAALEKTFHSICRLYLAVDRGRMEFPLKKI